jgi:hypothetical protein
MTVVSINFKIMGMFVYINIYYGSSNRKGNSYIFSCRIDISYNTYHTITYSRRFGREVFDIRVVTYLNPEISLFLIFEVLLDIKFQRAPTIGYIDGLRGYTHDQYLNSDTRHIVEIEATNHLYRRGVNLNVVKEGDTLFSFDISYRQREREKKERIQLTE